MDDVWYTDIVMSMYDLIEYIYNSTKISGSLFQYYTDQPALSDNGPLINFSDNNATNSSRFKENITSQISDDDTKNFEMMVPSKYLINFWRAFEMSLITCKIILNVTSYANWVILSNTENQAKTCTITSTKFYVPAVTLSTQDNAKLLQQLKLDIKRTINRNKY